MMTMMKKNKTLEYSLLSLSFHDKEILFHYSTCEIWRHQIDRRQSIQSRISVFFKIRTISFFFFFLLRIDNQAEKKISFAYQGLDSIPEHVLPADKHNIEYLDLTENNLDDLRFLIDIPNLRTLILDKNRINSNVKIPRLDMLHTIWINHNQISNLSVFIQTLATQCPQLKYLSMMNNPAAPSFFNGGSYQQYVDYRHYVISQLPRLIMLDDRQVSLEERQEAERIYTPMTLQRRERLSIKNQRSSLTPNSQ